MPANPDIPTSHAIELANSFKSRAKGKRFYIGIQKTRKLNQRQIKLIRESIWAIVTTSTRAGAAKMLNIHPATLTQRTQNYPEIALGVKDYVDSIVKDARRKIFLAAPRAAAKIEELVDNAKSENVQLQASTEILDRSGIIKQDSGTSIQVNILNDLKKDKDSYK